MDSTVFVGTMEGPQGVQSAGLFRRRPGDQGWTHLGEGVLSGSKVLAIAARPEDPQSLYIGTQNGIFHSADGGDTWSSLGLTVEGSAVYSILLHPQDTGTVYAGLDHTSICKTTDGGATWRKLPTVQPAAAIDECFPVRVLRMALDPNAPDELYAALEVGGFIRSLDGGESWEDRSAGLVEYAAQPHLKSALLSDNDTEGMLDLHALAVSPTQPGKVWIANRMGLFVSEDRGDTWREFEIGRYSPLTYGRDLIVNPHDPDEFLAALSKSSRGDAGSLYRSRDKGETWQRLDKGVSIDSTLMKVAVSPNDPDRIYCAARLGQVFGTEDGGETWNALPLPDGVIDVRAVHCV